MGWAEHRIEEYRRGRRGTWVERRMLEHAQPAHLVLGVLAAGAFGYGLWTHEWPWIVGGAALGLVGHLYGYLWRPPRTTVPAAAETP
ncbi:MAG: hypothetical protein ACKODX_00310 [Gemmata sp.]